MARLQELSVAGHVIVLLSHMKEIRLSRMQQDQHLSYRVLLLEGDPTPLPSIYLASPEENSFGQLVLPNIQALFEKLEQYDPSGERHHSLCEPVSTKKSLANPCILSEARKGYIKSS